MTDQPLMGLRELVARLGVSRQRVEQIAQHADFPRPYARLSAGRIWRTCDIDLWQNGKAYVVHVDALDNAHIVRATGYTYVPPGWRQFTNGPRIPIARIMHQHDATPRDFELGLSEIRDDLPDLVAEGSR
jgi:predicted DNA-binding transcriptional regulator AlpA